MKLRVWVETKMHMFDKEAVAKAVQLPAGQRIIVTQAIGYEKEE